MNKTPETNITNNSGSLITEENQQKRAYLLTRKVDEEIASQMKKIEVQKMEDDLTIKILEREYSESKRNFICSKKKLDDTRKKVSTQSETINELSQANKAIVEKFNELKRFQNEFILVNIDNAETTSKNCLNKNNVLSNTLRMITEKENYTKCLNKNIIDNKKKLNNDTKRELEEKKAVNDNLDKILKQSQKKLEILKMELAQEKIDNNFDELIQQNKKRITKLEIDDEVFQTQSKQEINDLAQQKNNKIQEIDNNNGSLKEKKESVSKLESELLLMERKHTALQEDLEKIQCKYMDILSEITKKREINELSKKILEENIINIKNEQNQINFELETAKAKFSKDENDLHKEFNSLLAKLENQKKLLKKIESSEQNLSKLKATNQVKQKELSNNKGLQDNLKKSTSELKKYQHIILIKNKKQSELVVKIEDLQLKKKSAKAKLESFKNEENVIDNTVESSNDCYTQISSINRKPLNSQKKLVYSRNDDECESKESNIISESPNKKQLSKSSCNKSIYSFDLFDTDESDDEVNLKAIIPETNDNHAYSDKLFDDLLSQKASKSSKTSKDTDLFKMPHAYMTPFRKKSNQSKKLFKN